MRRNIWYRHIGQSALIGAALTLSGCGAVSRAADNIFPDLNDSEFADAGFSRTDGNGMIDLNLVSVTERRINAAKEVGFAYKGGLDSEGDLRVVSGLNNEEDVERPTFNGTATFTGRAYAIYANANAALERNALEEQEAPITIRANLGTGDITGQTRETTVGQLIYRFDGRVSQSGTIRATGQFEDGTVEIDTTLTGRLSNSEAVAVFQGAGRSVAVAGGIYATR